MTRDRQCVQHVESMVAAGHSPVDIELLVSRSSRFMEEPLNLECSFQDGLDYFGVKYREKVQHMEEIDQDT